MATNVPSSRSPLGAACLLALLAAPACDGGGADEEASSATESPGDSTGSAIITVTIDDGTIYDFVDVSSCETNETHPDSFPFMNSYDLDGRTDDDAFLLSVARVPLDEKNAIFSGGLEGDFDSEGKNPQMIYVLDEDSLTLTVDGARVTGSADASALGPTRPHGDAPVITIDARCE